MSKDCQQSNAAPDEKNERTMECVIEQLIVEIPPVINIRGRSCLCLGKKRILSLNTKEVWCI